VIEVINRNPIEDELKKMSRDEILANYNKRVRFVVHLGQAIKLTHYEQGKAIVYLVTSPLKTGHLKTRENRAILII
jgi:hypothetical protein